MKALTTDETYYRRRERELFLEILDQPPTERSAALQQACGQDAVLRQRVESLLREETELGNFLEKPILEPITAASDPPAQGARAGGEAWPRGEQPGDTIDRYKLLQKLGEGGGGVVYLAEQAEPVRRRVALKIIKLGMDTKSVITRFEAERQALALMNHVSIARILEAGATETGRPYFVMEWVQGVRITDYCDQAKVSIEQRLRLFISVCQAVQHAHQKGIIHRDLKPSNILVTLQDGQPIPKIIDFGIAKATAQPLTDQTLTLHQALLGTPAYMSPEQANLSGVDIDTRSDIYSLGVILYELLTGQPPFDPEALRQADWEEMRRILREQEPPRPSTRLVQPLAAPGERAPAAGNPKHAPPLRRRSASLQELIRSLRGDLDWIIMRCLEKDRNRRYPTAHELAMDLQRYLDSEAVTARPPSPLYRLQKQYRRHRKTFAVAALMAAALLVATSFSTWQAVLARRAEHRAVQLQHKEVRLRQQAERQKAAAQLNAYVASINLAHKALSEGHLGRSIDLLNKIRPGPGEPDWRGFEWRYLWNLSRGDPHLDFPSLEGSVEALAISPRGDLLAVSTRAQTTLWNIAARSLVVRLPHGANSLAFSSDGDRLTTLHAAMVQVWNTSDGSRVSHWQHPGGMAALSPDGMRLAMDRSGPFSRGPRMGVQILETVSRKQTALLSEAASPLAFSPDGHLLVTASREGIHVWPLPGTEHPVLLKNSHDLMKPAGGRNFRVAFSPDRQVIAMPRTISTEPDSFGIGLWDVQSGQEIAVLPQPPQQNNHIAAITDLAFSPDGHYLSTASWDYSVRIWDVAARQCLQVLQGHRNEVWAVAFRPDGNALISGGKDGSIKLWPLNQPRKPDSIAGFGEPLAFSHDGRKLAAYDGSSGVTFFDPISLEAEERFQLEPPRFGSSSALAVSGDLKVLAVGWRLDRLQLLNTETRVSQELPIASSAVNWIGLSPDGAMLVTGGRDPFLSWWQLQPQPRLIRRIQAQRALFSPEGTLLAAVQEREVRLWEVTAQVVRVQITLSSSPTDLAFSPNGEILATTDNPFSVGNAISLWNTATGALLGVCSGHKQTVWSVAFSPDRKTLASASHDGTVKLWHVGTQQELLTLRPAEVLARELLFSPDGSILVMSGRRPGPGSHLHFLRAPFANAASR